MYSPRTDSLDHQSRDRSDKIFCFCALEFQCSSLATLDWKIMKRIVMVFGQLSKRREHKIFPLSLSYSPVFLLLPWNSSAAYFFCTINIECLSFTSFVTFVPVTAFFSPLALAYSSSKRSRDCQNLWYYSKGYGRICGTTPKGMVESVVLLQRVW